MCKLITTAYEYCAAKPCGKAESYYQICTRDCKEFMPLKITRQCCCSVECCTAALKPFEDRYEEAVARLDEPGELLVLKNVAEARHKHCGFVRGRSIDTT